MAMEYPHFQYGKRLQRVGSGVGFPGVPIGLIIVNRDVTSNLFLTSRRLARNLPKSRKNIQPFQGTDGQCSFLEIILYKK